MFLDLEKPIIQAPLGGGPGTPELVAAVCNVGALGSVGGAYLSPSQLEAEILKVQAQTTRPFAVNLFIPSPNPPLQPEQVATAVRATQTYRAELVLSAPQAGPPYFADFREQMDIIFARKPAVFSFTFGLPALAILEECRRLNILTAGTATTLSEALALEESGVDIVVAQGVEAGGHRGMFHPEDPDPALGTLELTRILVGKLRVPVVAAGGIMTGAGISDCLRAGAVAAQMGTAFLLCDEAATNSAYRWSLRLGGKTRLTKVFSGRWARGLENRFMQEVPPETILPWPAQNFFTRDIRAKAAQMARAEFLSLWAGEGVAKIRSGSATAIIEQLYREYLDCEKRSR